MLLLVPQPPLPPQRQPPAPELRKWLHTAGTGCAGTFTCCNHRRNQHLRDQQLSNWCPLPQVMNEGPGHVPLHKIPENMRLQTDWCNEVGTAHAACAVSFV